MRRLHLFEFGDLQWFPQILRDAETAYLTAAYRVWPALTRQWAEKISTVLHPNTAVEIVDLCAGSGGAMPQIIEDLRQRNYDVRAMLTDLYPNPNSGLDSRITWLLDPVDAMHVPPKLTGVTATVSAWLLLRTFSSGCTAMTGVEAVSNGVMAFRDPTDKYAKLTLTIIIVILMVLLLGIAYLVPAYGIAATDPNQSGYQSVLSQLLAAVTGRGAFYWVSIGSILVVLSLSANTAFADFPRLARAIAANGYLPHAFVLRGRRLVFAQGVYALAILTGALLIIFGGVTDRLIPLYAVGAFMAFTLSQAGMVVHWRRHPEGHSTYSMILNGVGALATGLTTAVVLVTKFVEGAWITVLLIPALIVMMRSVRRHYVRVGEEINAIIPVRTENLCEPIVLLPIDRWSLVAEKALRYAWTLSKEIHVLHVACGEDTDSLCRQWSALVEKPAQTAGLPAPKLVVLDSPYRFIVKPIVQYALERQQAEPDRVITVLIPELVEDHWYHYLLHNNRPEAIRALLMFNGNQRITVATIPYHLRA